MDRSVSNARSARNGRPRVSRAEAITRVTRLLEEQRTVRPLLADLCRASGVSERTLRSIFLEVFGVGPKRYMRMQKLHAVRSALVEADSRRETVSLVARRLGLSDIGRMARDYYALFGEYPRATLKCASTRNDASR